MCTLLTTSFYAKKLEGKLLMLPIKFCLYCFAALQIAEIICSLSFVLLIAPQKKRRFCQRWILIWWFSTGCQSQYSIEYLDVVGFLSSQPELILYPRCGRSILMNALMSWNFILLQAQHNFSCHLTKSIATFTIIITIFYRSSQ